MVPLHIWFKRVHISSCLANSSGPLKENSKTYKNYQNLGSLWILSDSKIPTCSRQQKMPQAAEKDKLPSNLCCSEQHETPNFASCLTLDVQVRVQWKRKKKANRLLSNEEEGMLLSSRKISPWKLKFRQLRSLLDIAMALVASWHRKAL